MSFGTWEVLSALDCGSGNKIGELCLGVPVPSLMGKEKVHPQVPLRLH